jgi:hypothetical protein
MPGTKYTAPGSSPSASEVDRPRLATPHEPSGHRSPVQPAPDLRFRIRGIDGESRRAVSLEETSKYFSADGILRELNALRYEEHDRVVAMLAAPGYSKRAVLIEGIDGSEEVTINAIRRFEVTMLDGAGSAVVDAGTTLSWWPEPPPDQVTSLAARMLLLFQETTLSSARAGPRTRRPLGLQRPARSTDRASNALRADGCLRRLRLRAAWCHIIVPRHSCSRARTRTATLGVRAEFCAGVHRRVDSRIRLRSSWGNHEGHHSTDRHGDTSRHARRSER